MLSLDLSNGAAGDMYVAALAGLGADRERIIDAVSVFGDACFSKINKSGFNALKFEVDYNPGKIGYLELVEAVKSIRLKKEAMDCALGILRVLAEAEAKAHQVGLREVHLHEAADCAVDAVAVAVALESLKMLEATVTATALRLGAVSAAAWEIIKSSSIPVVAPEGLEFMKPHSREKPKLPETCTPTGAAITAHLKPVFHGFKPTGDAGVGAGEMDLDYPNVLKAYLDERVYMLESNIDDATGEEIAHAMGELLDAKALDVSLHNCLMKKGRPGYLLRVLTNDPIRHGRLLMQESGSLGVRWHNVERQVLERHFMTETVDVEGVVEEINVKKTKFTSKPEYGDVAETARRHGLSYKQVGELVE